MAKNFFTKKTRSSKAPSLGSWRRHSVSESPQIMEEDVAPQRSDTTPRWHEEYTKFIHVVHRTTRIHEGAPPVPPWCSTRSSAPSPYTSRRPYGFIIKTKEEEEERRVRLEKRLLPNFDFDDALQVLDCTQILINLGWVQFFMELVWILTRSLIQKSLYISTGNRWRSVMPLISLWRWRATSSL
jgi:hypothetical protein